MLQWSTSPTLEIFYIYICVVVNFMTSAQERGNT